MPLPTIKYVDVGAAQAGVVLARKGSIPVGHRDHTRLPLLHFICFNNLGSRLFKLREERGLFYTAAAALGASATRKHGGMDFVATAVEHVDADATVKALRELLAGFAANPNVTPMELCAAKRWYEHVIVSRLHDVPEFCDAANAFARLYPSQTYEQLTKAHLAEVQSTTVADLNGLMRRVFSAPYEHVIVTR